MPRSSMKQVQIRLAEEDIKKLKIEAAHEDTTMQIIIERLVHEYLRKEGKDVD